MELLDKAIALVREGTLPVMLPLICACCGIGILLVDRLAYLYDPRSLLSVAMPWLRRAVRRRHVRLCEAFQAYANNRDESERRALLAACRGYRTPYSRFLERVAETTTGQPKLSILQLEVEAASLEEELAIERGMRMLSTLAKAAPLMGLMGTVTGMITTFAAMMVSSTSDPRALSSGISIALIATNVGLVVSLPGVIAMGLLSRRGLTLQEEIRLASMQIRSAAERQGEAC